MTHLEAFLAKSKELREAATPGPWKYDLGNVEVEGPERCHVATVANIEGRYEHLNGNDWVEDGDFIAHACNTSETKDEIIRVMAESMKETRNRADDYADSWISKPIREALAQVEEMAKEAMK